MGSKVTPLLTQFAVRQAGLAYTRSWEPREQNMNEHRLKKLAGDLFASKLKVMQLDSLAEAKPSQYVELHKWLKRNTRD